VFESYGANKGNKSFQREKKGKDLQIYDYDMEQRYPVAPTTVTEPDLKLDL
jgi:hypothetical protein